jgi:hypothetical protein
MTGSDQRALLPSALSPIGVGIEVAHLIQQRKENEPEPNRAPKLNRRYIMKSLTTKTLVVALSLTLCWTPSMAAVEFSGQPLSQSEKDTRSAAAATSAAPFYALNRLDAQTLAEQQMTDQELKATEGGLVLIAIIIPLVGLLLPDVKPLPR